MGNSEQAGSVCPICGRRYMELPAISRRDNTTDICPECGMMEALDSIPRGVKDCLGQRRYNPCKRHVTAGSA